MFVYSHMSRGGGGSRLFNNYIHGDIYCPEAWGTKSYSSSRVSRPIIYSREIR